MDKRGRKHAEYCSRGHLKEGDNLYVTPSTGQHHCRICKGMKPANTTAPPKPSRAHRRSGSRWNKVPESDEFALPYREIEPAPPPFRPAILDEWPVTLCRELPMDWMNRESHEHDETSPSA